MKQKLYHPAWRIVFVVGFIAFASKFLSPFIYSEAAAFWSVAKYIIGYGAALFAIVQVLLSKLVRTEEKITWTISLLFLAPLALILYCIVYKRNYGFYMHLSKA